MNLATALLHTARLLKGMRTGIATGGSTTTLVDTALVEPNDSLNGGTIFFLSGDLAGKTAVISDYADTTKTVTFDTQSAAVVAGVRYAIAPPTYTREALVQAINSALTELGPMLQRDTSLTTVANQQEYDLPAGVYNIKRVEISSNTTAPYTYLPPHHWWMEWDGKLIFSDLIPAYDDLSIRLWYEAPHAEVLLDADTISDSVHPMRLAWTAAWFAAMSRAGIAENSEPYTKELAQLADQKAAMESKHPIRTIARDVRWSRWGSL